MERLQEEGIIQNALSGIKKMLFHKGFQHNIMNIQTRFRAEAQKPGSRITQEEVMLFNRDVNRLKEELRFMKMSRVSNTSSTLITFVTVFIGTFQSSLAMLKNGRTDVNINEDGDIVMETIKGTIGHYYNSVERLTPVGMAIVVSSLIVTFIMILKGVNILKIHLKVKELDNQLKKHLKD